MNIGIREINELFNLNITTNVFLVELEDVKCIDYLLIVNIRLDGFYL